MLNACPTIPRSISPFGQRWRSGHIASEGPDHLDPGTWVPAPENGPARFDFPVSIRARKIQKPSRAKHGEP
jgi:hypothetical protein